MQQLFCGQRTKLPATSVNKNVAYNPGKQCIMPTSRPSLQLSPKWSNLRGIQNGEKQDPSPR